MPRVTAEGQSNDEAAGNPALHLESIHPNYFSTIEAPIVRGRPFSAADRPGTVEVAIVSEDVAARLWPGQNPIGKRLTLGRVEGAGRWLEVVGVAVMTRYRTVTTPRPTLYLPAAQFQMTAAMLVVRSTASLESLTSAARERIRAIDSEVTVLSASPFADYLARPLGRPRFNAFLAGLFGLAALLLSTLGLYAVMAAYVRQRDREIAVRLALGATGATAPRIGAAGADRDQVPGRFFARTLAGVARDGSEARRPAGQLVAGADILLSRTHPVGLRWEVGAGRFHAIIVGTRACKASDGSLQGSRRSWP